MPGFTGTLAESNRVSLYFSEETVWAEAVPGTLVMNQLQFTSINGGHKKATVVPATIRNDRMQESIVRVGENTEFGFNFELRHTQYDPLFLAAISATAYTSASLTAIDISAAASDNSLNSVAGAFVSSGFVAGMWIKVSGFTGGSIIAGNTAMLIVSVTTTKMIVSGATLIDDAAGESVTITGKMARNGVAKHSYILEQRFNDIPEYQPFLGSRLNQLDLTMNNRSIITGAMTFLGYSGVAAGSTIATTSTAAASNVAMDSSNNVVLVNEAGVALTTPIFNATLRINNNLAAQPAVANRFPVGIRYGVMEVTGNIEVYFTSLALWTKFVNHTATSLVFKLQDDNGKWLIITLPRIQFSEGDIPTPSQNADVFLNLPFRASYSSTLVNQIQIDSLA